MGGFYGCYLLISRNQRRAGTTYIGCGPARAYGKRQVPHFPGTFHRFASVLAL